MKNIFNRYRASWDALSRKEKTSAQLLWIVACLLGSYIFLFPKFLVLLNIHTQLRNTAKTGLIVMQEIQQQDEILQKLQARYEMEKSKPPTLQGILTGEGVHLFLSDWNRMAVSSGVNIVSIQTGTEASADLSQVFAGQLQIQAQEIPVEMVVRGTFRQLVIFFNRLSMSTRLPKVETLNILSGEGLYPVISVSLKLKLYSRKETVQEAAATGAP